MAALLGKNPGGLLVDVGCDHGYLGLAALREGRVALVLDVDDKAGPLSAARRNAARHGLAGRVFCVRGDGLKGLPESLDPAWIAIAGLGARKIVGILSSDRVGKPGTKYLLQAQEAPALLEAWLDANGFGVLRADETACGGRTYRFVTAVRGGPEPAMPARRAQN